MLKNIPVVNTKLTSGGNVVMNFANESEREMAAARIRSGIKDVDTQVTKKFHPKIMICNVSKEENKTDVIDYLIAENSYLQSVVEVQEKVKLIFDKPAAGDTVHYILRCSPDVRELTHKHGEVVCLKWGRYSVRDRYHVFNCYYCQSTRRRIVNLKVMVML